MKLPSVLIIDDDLELAASISQMLSDWACCNVSSNAKDASELLLYKSFDIVITDIEMPSGGGERILSELSNRKEIVYVFTGCNNKARFTKLGARKVFLKPDGIDDLIDELERMRWSLKLC